MPNDINSQDWTIDQFSQSQIFPLIVPVTNYRDFVLSQNLPDVNQHVTNNIPNATLNDRGSQFNVDSGRLSSPGDLDNWLTDGGYEVGVHEVRDIGMLRKENKYGPEFIEAYNCPNLTQVSTGFIQYKTSAGGDIRSTLLGKQLGFGFGSGINFDSELSEIGKKRRKEEVINRIKSNAKDNTLGKINLDPFSLLTGNDLITKDYTITKGTGLGGQIFNFATDLIGFNVPVSIIPDGAFGSYGTDDSKSNESLLKFTGAGQKSLLFKAIQQNKYGPSFGSSEVPVTGKGISKLLKKAQNFTQKLGGPGEPPVIGKYTDSIPTTKTTQEEFEKNKSIVDKINSKVGKTIDGLKNKIVGGVPESELPSIDEDDVTKNSGYGFDTLYGEKTDTWDTEDYDDSTSIGVNMEPIDIPQNLPPFDGLMFWGENSPSRPKRFQKGILNYTQELINLSINEPKSKARFIGVMDTDFNYNENGSHIRYSKGNTVTADDGSYCRSWSTRRPYTRVEDLIRHSGLNRGEKINSLSVLEDNGFVKIAPYKNTLLKEGELFRPNPGITKYMLSLENLAWQGSDHLFKVPPCEIGPNGGRIMWFPPYDISFSDNSSANWDTTTFIGRGEPIYTYNNSERNGTLTFKIIVDHPSSFNKKTKKGISLREEAEEVLFRYFAGCGDPFGAAELIVPQAEIEEIKVEESEKDTVETPQPQAPQPPTIQETQGFFRNASNCLKVSDCTVGKNITEEISSGYNPNGNNTKFVNDIKSMVDFLLTEDGKRYKIKVVGKTSGAAPSSFNQELSILRAKSAKEYILKLLIDGDNTLKKATNLGREDKTYKTEKEQSGSDNNPRWLVVGFGELGATSKNDENFVSADNDPNAKEAIDDRRVVVTLEYNPQIDSDVIGTEEPKDNTQTTGSGSNTLPTFELVAEKPKDSDEVSKELAKAAANYVGWECDYFEKMKQDDSFVYESLTEKLKYFHPAFHSMTPEGFNSRLTFLQQCVRQGPSIDKKGPFNMAFGKPPICVLRIGDFYHTKIVIDTVNFTYDPIQWDLNPEGIGVQPMVVSVDLNFKFIGGSSLGGPINELQNAVSFNFFANTALYNPRKVVTTVSKSIDPKTNLPTDTTNVEVKPFGFGAYLKPGDVGGTDNNILPPDESNKDKTQELNDKTTPNQPTTSAPISETDKDKINNEKPKGQSASDILEFTTSGGVVNGSPIITKVTFTIKDSEKSKWEILTLEFDSNGSTGRQGSVAADKKTVTYSDFESDVDDVGDYKYTFRCIVRTIEGPETQQTLTKSITNTIK